MNIGDYVLYEDQEYTIDAKTTGGERFKLSRNVRSKGFFREIEETITHWVDRSEIQQIMTMVGDDLESPEEVVLRNYGVEISQLVKDYDQIKEKLDLIAGIDVFENLTKGDWTHYRSDYGDEEHRFYEKSVHDGYQAPSFKELMLLLGRNARKHQKS